MSEGADDGEGPSLASEVRQQFALAVLPEGRDFAGTIDGSIAVETAERDGVRVGVAMDERGGVIESTVVVDLEHEV